MTSQQTERPAPRVAVSGLQGLKRLPGFQSCHIAPFLRLQLVDIVPLFGATDPALIAFVLACTAFGGRI